MVDHLPGIYETLSSILNTINGSNLRQNTASLTRRRKAEKEGNINPKTDDGFTSHPLCPALPLTNKVLEANWPALATERPGTYL